MEVDLIDASNQFRAAITVDSDMKAAAALLATASDIPVDDIMAEVEARTQSMPAEKPTVEEAKDILGPLVLSIAACVAALPPTAEHPRSTEDRLFDAVNIGQTLTSGDRAQARRIYSQTLRDTFGFEAVSKNVKLMMKGNEELRARDEFRIRVQSRLKRRATKESPILTGIKERLEHRVVPEETSEKPSPSRDNSVGEQPRIWISKTNYNDLQNGYKLKPLDIAMLGVELSVAAIKKAVALNAKFGELVSGVKPWWKRGLIRVGVPIGLFLGTWAAVDAGLESHGMHVVPSVGEVIIDIKDSFGDESTSEQSLGPPQTTVLVKSGDSYRLLPTTSQ